MADMLTKLFFVHFRKTSFVAETDGVLAGFLVGFLSRSFSNQSYIHFADFREQGMGRLLYERFFSTSLEYGRDVVRCVTSPVNKGSIAFHNRMGFTMEPSDAVVEGVPVCRNYDGRGGDRVLFVKRLTAK